jgi:hypothetical protein
MRAEQTLAEMAEEMLLRQARIFAWRTGQPLGRHARPSFRLRLAASLGS